MKDLKTIALQITNDHFYTFTGFITGTFIIIISYIPLDNFFEKLIQDIYLRMFLLFLIILFWAFYWIYKRNEYPQTKKDLIGLIIAIQAENDIQMLRIKNDFAKNLKKYIKENNLDNLIDVLVLNNYQSKQTDYILNKYSQVINRDISLESKVRKKYVKEWTEFQNKIHGHFFITGNIKVRNDGERKYILDNLRGLVIHKEVNSQISTIIKNEFINSWWETIHFPEKFELSGFSLSADLIYIAAKYIIGIAALVSGDANTAIKLHENLSSSFSKFKKLPPNLTLINERYKTLLAEEYLIKAREYNLNNNTSKVREYLDKSFKLVQNNYAAYIMESIYYFVIGNLNKAIESINNAEKYSNTDGTWRYNKAFLLVYTGNLKEGFKVYRDISHITYQNEESTLKQVYEFCEQLLKKEKKKYILNFILGFLYFKKDNNYPLSLKYFETFIKSCKQKQEFKLFIKKVIAYKNICEKEMGLN